MLLASSMAGLMFDNAHLGVCAQQKLAQNQSLTGSSLCFWFVFNELACVDQVLVELQGRCLRSSPNISSIQMVRLRSSSISHIQHQCAAVARFLVKVRKRGFRDVSVG